jgi:hypothetical protein
LEIHFHLLLEVFHHLGVHFLSEVHLCLEVHHLLSKVQSPFLVVFHSHEEDYHYFS